ncbi:hypothetical protein S40288_08860 [Stachybotrys chartarum IBT 40288]|nr:hypothetical protein S40288_08860 [Stachybotrys chartarum IBT 40288]
MVPQFKNLAEPLFIVAAFTAGTLINRRRKPPSRSHAVDLEASPDASLLFKPPAHHLDVGSPPASLRVVVSDLLSRFFTAYPFLIEIWYWNLTYWIYQLARAVSAVNISSNASVFLLARSHALRILSLESTLGIAVEQPLQAYLLARHPWVMPLLARVYYSHISLGVCFLVYVYTYLPAPLFQRIRRTIAVDNAIAFVVVSLWRCAPPRLLPAEYGFVDVLHGALAASGNAWTHNRFQLTIAAMPSLHFGTALFFAVCIVRYSPHRWLRCLAPLWPAAMLFTIVATANHFLADAFVGAFVPLLGWELNQSVLILHPIQEKLVSLLSALSGSQGASIRRHADSLAHHPRPL